MLKCYFTIDHLNYTLFKIYLLVLALYWINEKLIIYLSYFFFRLF